MTVVDSTNKDASLNLGFLSCISYVNLIFFNTLLLTFQTCASILKCCDTCDLFTPLPSSRCSIMSAKSFIIISSRQCYSKYNTVAFVTYLNGLYFQIEYRMILLCVYFNSLGSVCPAFLGTNDLLALMCIIKAFLPSVSIPLTIQIQPVIFEEFNHYQIQM